jgi:peptidyl-prolyl cis-trans isomerase B (cyclophilin B)
MPPSNNEEKPAPGASAVEPRLQQSFAEATRPDPPPDWPRPPDVTVTGKSVGKLYTEVIRHWKEIPFTTPEGKRVTYRATLETDLGAIEITLLPDLAPNHVRNFVALARAQYYDGLMFERIVHQVSPEKDVQVDLIEGGGPLGIKDADYDGIGYWLKAEIDPKAVHQEGSVGAHHGEDLDTAACKFYIVVNQPPSFLNGNYTIFGKVTRGLEVARKIHQQPVRVDEQDPGNDRPEKPVVINKVVIQANTVDNQRAGGDNKN